MKETTALLLCGLFVTSSLFAESPVPPSPLAKAEALGVSLEYPASLAFTQEVDEAGTKLKFKKDNLLPWILVQVYSVEATPSQVLEINTQIQRDACREKGWPFRENPTHQTIAAQEYSGTELVYKVKELEFRQRYLSLMLRGHAVLVMTLSKTSDDALTLELLAPIAASLH